MKNVQQHRICFVSGLFAYQGTASQAAFAHLRHC